MIHLPWDYLVQLGEHFINFDPVLQIFFRPDVGALVDHVVPTMGVRIESKRSGGVVAYSSDTAPCDAVVELARDANILLHEAAKSTPGHSSAAQAGEIACRAGAQRLVLIHYRPAPHRYDRWIQEASEAFGGPVELAQDFGEYQF